MHLGFCWEAFNVKVLCRKCWVWSIQRNTDGSHVACVRVGGRWSSALWSDSRFCFHSRLSSLGLEQLLQTERCHRTETTYNHPTYLPQKSVIYHSVRADFSPHAADSGFELSELFSPDQSKWQVSSPSCSMFHFLHQLVSNCGRVLWVYQRLRPNNEIKHGKNN